MRNFSLDGRLRSVSRFVRQGALFADVGTDHAYLPLYLLQEGIISRAVCTDINEGPLSCAVENAKAANVEDRIEFCLADGAAVLDGKGVTDVGIAGMGGELIADIIDGAPFLRDGRIRLILQPMSKQAHLRRYLAKHGFEILSEDYSHDGGKYYVTLCVTYSGREREISLIEANFGSADFLRNMTPCTVGYLTTKRNSLARVYAGKARADLPCEEEKELIEFIDGILR